MPMRAHLKSDATVNRRIFFKLSIEDISLNAKPRQCQLEWRLFLDYKFFVYVVATGMTIEPLKSLLRINGCIIWFMGDRKEDEYEKPLPGGF
jgi:hypothetical protein